MSLRSETIKLAYLTRALRSDLLPLLRQAGPPDAKPARTSQTIQRGINTAPFGKKVGGDLYVHKNSWAKGNFDPVLAEMYNEALAYQPNRYTILKFSSKKGGMVSFLYYPTFDTDAHPPQASYQTVTLETEKVSVAAYGNLQKAPILHRKETMVDPGYPNRGVFEALTRAEENAGLLSRPPGQKGTWDKLVAENGYRIEGHQLNGSVA